MKLSIIILCWNDSNVISHCLQSIYSGTHSTEFEVIVSDNGSTDGSIALIRSDFPQVYLIENGSNLRFAKANNVGIRASKGEYVLILNPDTIIHDGALDKLIRYADANPKAGAFGCRVLNPDGSYQESGRPFPSICGDWVAALYSRPLAHLSTRFLADTYIGWKGDRERTVDWQSGCCLMIRGKLLRELGGFDEQFFYYYEDVDLCRRVWLAGYPILFTPDPTITHLGGQSTKRRLPLGFAIDKYITRYRYYYKYYGKRGARRCRLVSLVSLFIRMVGLGLTQIAQPTDDRALRLEIANACIRWNVSVDPIRLVESGEEPRLYFDLTARVLER